MSGQISLLEIVPNGGQVSLIEILPIVAQPPAPAPPAAPPLVIVLMATPATTEHDIDIEQGEDVAMLLPKPVLPGNPTDLTGYTARMQLRASLSSEDVLLDLTTANGGLVTQAQSCDLWLVVRRTLTEGVTWRRGSYDIEMIDPTGRVTRTHFGRLNLSPEITRNNP